MTIGQGVGSRTCLGVRKKCIHTDRCKQAPYQEYNWRIADQGDGGGQFSFVAPGVVPGDPRGVLQEAELTDPPLRHLEREQRE